VWLSHTNLEMKATLLCEYQVYAIKSYAINPTIFFTYGWVWFEIPESYLIKQFMRLTDMQLS